jgi:hypothetical protein
MLVIAPASLASFPATVRQREVTYRPTEGGRAASAGFSAKGVLATAISFAAGRLFLAEQPFRAIENNLKQMSFIFANLWVPKMFSRGVTDYVEVV